MKKASSFSRFAAMLRMRAHVDCPLCCRTISNMVVVCEFNHRICGDCYDRLPKNEVLWWVDSNVNRRVARCPMGCNTLCWMNPNPDPGFNQIVQEVLDNTESTSPRELPTRQASYSPPRRRLLGPARMPLQDPNVVRGAAQERDELCFHQACSKTTLVLFTLTMSGISFLWPMYDDRIVVDGRLLVVFCIVSKIKEMLQCAVWIIRNRRNALFFLEKDYDRFLMFAIRECVSTFLFGVCLVASLRYVLM